MIRHWKNEPDYEKRVIVWARQLNFDPLKEKIFSSWHVDDVRFMVEQNNGRVDLVTDALAMQVLERVADSICSYEVPEHEVIEDAIRAYFPEWFFDDKELGVLSCVE